MKVVDLMVGEVVVLRIGDKECAVRHLAKSGKRVRLGIDADKSIYISNAEKGQGQVNLKEL